MSESLMCAIEETRANPDLASYDEARTKQAIILRLLSALGWNMFQPDEVCTEYVTFGKRADYSLRIGGINKVFVEVKKTTVPLDPCEEQLLGYAFQQGIRLAVLTNGITWQLYLPLHEGTWKERKFYTLDIQQQEPVAFANRMSEFLSRASIENGESVQSAEQMMLSSARRQILGAALPAAWNEIVEKPSELLVELINEVVEKSCGFAAEEEFIHDFLRKHSPRFIVSGLTEKAYGRSDSPVTSRMEPSIQSHHTGARADFHMDCIPKVEASLQRLLPHRSRNMWYSSDRTVAVCCACSNEKPAGWQYWFTIQRSQVEKLSRAQEGYLALGCGSAQNTLLIPKIIVDEFLPRLPRATASQQDGWHFYVNHDAANWLLRSSGRESKIDITHFVL